MGTVPYLSNNFYRIQTTFSSLSASYCIRQTVSLSQMFTIDKGSLYLCKEDSSHKGWSSSHITFLERVTSTLFRHISSLFLSTFFLLHQRRWFKGKTKWEEVHKSMCLEREVRKKENPKYNQNSSEKRPNTSLTTFVSWGIGNKDEEILCIDDKNERIYLLVNSCIRDLDGQPVSLCRGLNEQWKHVNEQSRQALLLETRKKSNCLPPLTFCDFVASLSVSSIFSSLLFFSIC